MKKYHLNPISCTTAEIHAIAADLKSDDNYILIIKPGTDPVISDSAIKEMEDRAKSMNASAVYSDYRNPDGSIHPLIDWHEGSVREGFDFGPAMLVNASLFAQAAAYLTDYSFAGFYALRLALSRLGNIAHIPVPLYSTNVIPESDTQFAYQQEDRRLAQREMEDAFSGHLKEIGAYITPSDVDSEIEFDDDFPVEASIVIPVRNRVRTIGDAVKSALTQITGFDFNVIVVDNHSTDGTTELLKTMAMSDRRLIHIIPEDMSHGIGGCWNIALDDYRCGRFAVQLDSDDIYSSPYTLSKIVGKFYEEHCPMIVGSYTLTDFNGKEIPPGLIAHSEWTDDNGRNNALRINGLGAPRAFYTPIAREIRFPDVSYGEDYAMGLAISGQYRIGRIYESLYLCRRWEGNSDSGLTIEAMNRNDIYKDSLRRDAINSRKALLESRRTHKTVIVKGCEWNVRLLPGRAVSTKAKVDPESIASRPCFLCRENRPPNQPAKPFLDYEILENPFPVFPGHLTIVSKTHQPQRILGRTQDMVELAEYMPDHTIFYNGAECGASAPDHCHFQAVPETCLPLDHDYPFRRIYLYGSIDSIAGKIEAGIASLQDTEEKEPPVNVAIHALHDNMAEAVIIPRKAHRPKCYPGIGVSPGAIDVLGTIITTSRDDFDKIDSETLAGIFDDVTFPSDPPEISVGILEAGKIEVHRLSGNRFMLKNVVIGKEFHWQRNLDLTYSGSLEIISDGDREIAINRLSAEEYLRSVIASEMSPAAPLEFLKTHAVISRSWVLSQINRKGEHHDIHGSFNDSEIVKWYDRDNHARYDVCADDHCQRYQGIPKSEPENVRRAILSTFGEVLVDGDNGICDARFSKCCGGMMEEFETCWENRHHNYLIGKMDAPSQSGLPDLTDEATARRWIMSRPAEPFCANASPELLRKILNSYDRETRDYYRWTVEYSVQELSEIVKMRSGIDFGEIQELVPLARGASGRIYRLKIIGGKRTMIVGKELEIRKWLSRSHLYSSAFVVEKDNGRFRLHGAGWGHGVGLCQIGAAVMASNGYDYQEILSHYYPDAELTRLY